MPEYAFENLWNLLVITRPQIDWADTQFDERKAYVMCLFSSLAYEHMTRYEIEHKRRAKVIPCFAYQKRLATLTTVDIDALRQRLEGSEIIVLESVFAVYIIIKVGDLIVIAVRGTASLYYDLRPDLDAREVRFIKRNRHGFFHKGFYDEAIASAPLLLIALRKLGAFTGNPDQAKKIYITGHSLGGAVAAILYGTWIADRTNVTVGSPFNVNPWDLFVCHSGYTFGMPKFANAEIVQNFRATYHVRSLGDPFPYLPPGFVRDERQEIVLERYRPMQAGLVKTFAVGLYLSSIGRILVKDHRIDTYRTKLARKIGIDDSGSLLPDFLLKSTL